MKFMPIELFHNTPLDAWWQSGVVFKSKYLLAHISDAARLALVWKYGGVYSDLDTITLKSFERLSKRNGVGYIFENNADSVGNGVLVFEKKQHEFVREVMDEFVRAYNPYVWGANGPSMILKAIKAYCHVANVLELVVDEKKNSSSSSQHPCDMRVFPEDYFYPFRYIDGEFEALFRGGEEGGVRFGKLKNAYSVHYYGFKSRDMRVDPRANSFFAYLAACNCEQTFKYVESSGNVFE
jgi:hypothetical protein